jgi:hypothetical protein
MAVNAGRGGLQKTSSCPVKPQLSSIEHWPHPIAMLRISDFRFAPPAEQGCTY